jgi:hypothetical protein
VVDLLGRNAATFVREVEAEAAKIVGKYVPKTETLRSWDIRGSNVRLDHVFELNRLPYVGYPGDDYADVAVRRGKKVMTTADEGPSQGTASGATAKKRKLGTAAEGSRASDRFGCGFAGDVHGSRGDDVFAQASGNFRANAEGYQESLA